jgi:hypothetical protein
MGEPEQNGVRDIAELLGKVFAAFFAIAYASGYLTFADHLEELGIRDSGANIIRAKYVWLGFLYLLPFLSLSALGALLWMMTPPKLVQKFPWVFPRPNLRKHKYTNKYSQIVVVTTATLSARMMFFDARWREDSSWLMCITVGSLLAYQLVHRVELLQKNT